MTAVTFEATEIFESLIDPPNSSWNRSIDRIVIFMIEREKRDYISMLGGFVLCVMYYASDTMGVANSTRVCI